MRQLIVIIGGCLDIIGGSMLGSHYSLTLGLICCSVGGLLTMTAVMMRGE